MRPSETKCFLILNYSLVHLGHVAQHQLGVILDWSDHGGQSLTALALLGEASEAAVHQHLVPAGIVT